MRTGIPLAIWSWSAASLLSACQGETTVSLERRATTEHLAAAVVSSARLVPEAPRTDDVLRVEASAQGSVDLACAWMVNGTPLPSDSCVLDGATSFEKGDLVEVSIIPRAEGAPALPVVLEPVVVGNTSPEAARLELDPLQPQATVDDLQCHVTPGLDADGDPLEVNVHWDVDGRPWTGPALSRAHPQDTIPADVLSTGTEWTCLVTVSDDTDTAPPVEASVSVQPAPPWGEELLADGSFESTFSSWEAGDRGCEAVRAEELGLEPVDGEHVLFGGEGTESCSLVQRIDLLDLGFPEALVDSGVVAVEAELWLAGHLPAGILDDQSWLTLRYLDELGRPLGSLSTLIGGDDDWIHRQAQGLLPVGTRSVQVGVTARYVRGERNDAVADAVSVRIQRVEQELPLISKRPLLQDYRQEAMRLIWETDRNLTHHSVEWGPAGGPLMGQIAAVDTIHVDDTHFVHRAIIPGLEAATEYGYRVRAGPSATDTWTFRTAPLETDPVVVAWVADNQNRPDTFRGIVEQIAAQDPDLVVAPGDIVEDGYKIEDWQDQWFGPLEQSDLGQTVPVLSARGNHERHHPYTLAYTALPGHGDWYSFRYGPLFIVVLDSELGTYAELDRDAYNAADLGDLGAEQAEFLREALRSDEATSAAWKIVTFHYAPFTNSRHDDSQTGSPVAQAHWVEVFEEEGVDMVISGHYHSYQRGEQNGVLYVVTGGGGGALDDRIVENVDFFEVIEQIHHYDTMTADDETLVWQTWDLEDELVDEVILQR